MKWIHIEKWAGLLIICVRTLIHYCNTNNTSTLLVMEGIRAGWNKAFWTIYYCFWNRNIIMPLAGPWCWHWHFSGEESGPLLRQSVQHSCTRESDAAIQKEHKKKKKKKKSFADSCHHWKRNGAVDIKVREPRLYTAAESESKGLVER